MARMRAGARISGLYGAVPSPTSAALRHLGRARPCPTQYSSLSRSHAGRPAGGYNRGGFNWKEAPWPHGSGALPQQRSVGGGDSPFPFPPKHIALKGLLQECERARKLNCY